MCWFMAAIFQLMFIFIIYVVVVVGPFSRNTNNMCYYILK